jgi:hypothetical protein
MDKLTLTPLQLKELELFIYKKGFKDPVVKNEILDHFACKVEEKLADVPSTNLDEAMQKAHADFGYSGFRLIQDNLEKELKTRYKKYFRAEIKKVLLSVHGLIIMPLFGFLTFKSYLWAHANHHMHVLGQNDVETAAELVCMAIMLFTGRKMIFRARDYYYSVAASSILWYNPLLLLLLTPNQPHSYGELIVYAVVTSFMMMALYILQLPLLRTYRQVENDSRHFNELIT